MGNYDDQLAGAIGLSYYTKEAIAFNLGVAASDSEVMGSLGFAYKFGKGNRQEKASADPSSTEAMHAQIQELQAEKERLQAQVNELKQLLFNYLNSRQTTEE